MYVYDESFSHTYIQAKTAADERTAKSNRNISLVLSRVTISTVTIAVIVGIAIVFGVVFGYYYPLAQKRVKCITDTWSNLYCN